MDLQKLREQNITVTEHDLRESITPDTLVIQLAHAIDELIKIDAKLTNHLKERMMIYAPESIEAGITSASLIRNKHHDASGKAPTPEEYMLLNELVILSEQTEKIKTYHEELCQKYLEASYTHLLTVCGSIITRQLVAHTGSLKRLATLPSSTIQVLGAEKALFRHVTTGARAPKFGITFIHESISKAQNKGQAARKLAAKISIAARQDYFKK